MKINLANVAGNYKENLEIRLANDNEESEFPYLSSKNIEYDISGGVSAIHCGGIGIADQIVNR